MHLNLKCKIVFGAFLLRDNVADAEVEGGWAEADYAMPPIRVPRLRRPLKAGRELQRYLSAYYSSPQASVPWQNRMVAKNRGKFFFKFGIFWLFSSFEFNFNLMQIYYKLCK